MTKIVSAKKTNAMFLLIVLVAGTFAAMSPSFIIGVEAQAQPYYEDTYKPAYPSDNSYKSKDSSSTIVKKVKCNNINTNNNGVNVNLGLPSNDAIAEAQAADNEGQATTTNGERNGYKQNSNDFKFVCINNNDNEFNVVVVNETTPEPPDTITCEECFLEFLSPSSIEQLNLLFESGGIGFVIGGESFIATSIPELCELISDILAGEVPTITPGDIVGLLGGFIINPVELTNIILCLGKAFDFDTLETTTFDINTDINTNDLQIAQETEDSPTLAKIEKLKQQWLNLLP